MSEMKRWNVPDGSDYECSDGDFVLYADHQVAIAALEEQLRNRDAEITKHISDIAALESTPGLKIVTRDGRQEVVNTALEELRQAQATVERLSTPFGIADVEREYGQAQNAQQADKFMEWAGAATVLSAARLSTQPEKGTQR